MKAVICPVCGGNGLVANGFYNHVGNEWATASTNPETCRGCGGSGWVTVHEENPWVHYPPVETKEIWEVTYT